jgi:hypothetical protein
MIQTIRRGVHYVVKSFTGKTDFEIVFTHRDKDRKPVEGITTEALLMVLIDRTRVNNHRRYSRENDIVLKHLESALQAQKELVNDKVRIGHIGV